MKNGFTLIELLCVIIIMGILLILAIPSITNIIGDEKDNISDTMNNIIIQSAEVYMQNNREFYTKTDGNIYCISLNTLVDEEYLSNPIIDPITNDEISLDKYVRISVENGEYTYIISNECTSVNN